MMQEWYGGQHREYMFTETNLDWLTASKNAYMLFYTRKDEISTHIDGKLNSNNS